MLRIVFLSLVFFMMIISVKAETMKEMTTSLFDKNLVFHHEKPFKDICTQGVNFYRLVSGGGNGYNLEEYRSILKDDDKQLVTYGYTEDNDGSRWEYALDDVTWKKINALFQTFDYKTFQKEDSIGHVFDAPLYRMEICQNGHPFIYYRYSWNVDDDKKSNRSKSMALISKYRSILYRSYRKQKRHAKYISITEETRLKNNEEELAIEREWKESRDKAHRKYVKKLQEQL